MTQEIIQEETPAEEVIVLQEGEELPGQGGESEAKQAEAKAAEAREVIESRARNLGWVPKEEFHGDPTQWKDAEDFVRHGEETLPVLRENLRKLHTKLDEQGRVMKDFAEYHKKTEERAFHRALKRLKDEQLEAVGDGDKKKFKEIEGEIEDLQKDHEKEGARGKEADPAMRENPAFAEWQEENPWYGDNVEMTIYADQAGGIISSRNRGITAAALYKKVTAEVKKKFPNSFKNPRRSQASTVEGDTPAAGNSTPMGRTYSDMPAAARKACDDFVKEKLLTREEYVKDYFAE